MQNIRPTAPLKTLLLLGAGVLAAHLLLLQQAQRLTWRWDRQPQTLRMVLRGQDVPPPVLTPSPPAPGATGAAAYTASPRSARHAGVASVSPDTSRAATVPAAATVAASPLVPAADPPAPTRDALSSAPVSLPAPALLVPPPTRLLYEVNGMTRGRHYSAQGELLWRHDGERYAARLEIGTVRTSARIQTSRGRITAGGLEPQRFSDKVRSEVAAHFERDKARIVFSANRPPEALQAGAQDHLSAFIQLASLFAGRPTSYPGGSTLELQAVGAREANLWQVRVEDWRTLELPGGAQDTLKLYRPPARPYDLRADIWLAPALGWLPARIRLTQDNGDYVDLLWRATEAPTEPGP